MVGNASSGSRDSHMNKRCRARRRVLMPVDRSWIFFPLKRQRRLCQVFGIDVPGNAFSFESRDSHMNKRCRARRLVLMPVDRSWMFFPLKRQRRLCQVFDIDVPGNAFSFERAYKTQCKDRKTYSFLHDCEERSYLNLLSKRRSWMLFPLKRQRRLC